ncbi:MAG: hypothetical protein EBW85_06720 [Burkholderiaceae bacterium]|nr:hypothetical protein [Burkholderiaceae bacterium]
MKRTISESKRIVVKVGSTLVTNNGAGLDRNAIATWAEQVSTLLKQGCQVLMVSSSLAALVVNLVHADALVILTDQGGLYTADPRKDTSATMVDFAIAGDPTLERMAGGAGSDLGKGGMLTKVLAAKTAVGTGASTVIASGREPNVLVRLYQGESIGTLLSKA